MIKNFYEFLAPSMCGTSTTNFILLYLSTRITIGEGCNLCLSLRHLFLPFLVCFFFSFLSFSYFYYSVFISSTFFIYLLFSSFSPFAFLHARNEAVLTLSEISQIVPSISYLVFPYLFSSGTQIGAKVFSRCAKTAGPCT